jgi:hypothetical protein
MPSRNELRRWASLGILREAVAKLHQRAREAFGERGEDQRQAEDAEENESGNASELVGADCPASADGGEAGDQREGDCHARQQRQAALAKWLVGAREDKRQHRKNARTEDGENATESTPAKATT